MQAIRWQKVKNGLLFPFGRSECCFSRGNAAQKEKSVVFFPFAIVTGAD